MKVLFSPAAEQDLLAIGLFIAQDNPVRALSFMEELEARCLALRDYPKLGKARDEVRPGLRSLFWESYVVFYTLSEATLRIERILHGSRDLNRLFS